MWDLQRNGGSVQATTERVLMGRGLDVVCYDVLSAHEMTSKLPMDMILTVTQPPPSFQPQIPQAAAIASSTPRPLGLKPITPDLITRYNLSTKIASPSDQGQATSVESKPPGWSANKNERAEALKRRREDMVLAARRKMEEKDRQKAGAA